MSVREVERELAREQRDRLQREVVSLRAAARAALGCLVEAGDPGRAPLRAREMAARAFLLDALRGRDR